MNATDIQEMGDTGFNAFQIAVLILAVLIILFAIWYLDITGNAK